MKKTITTLTLAAIMMFGATFANAGIIITDRASNATTTSDQTTNRDGIIVFGRDGIIVFGIIVFGSTETNGIIVFGNSGDR